MKSYGDFISLSRRSGVCIRKIVVAKLYDQSPIRFQTLSSSLLNEPAIDGPTHKLKIIEAAEEMFRKDVETNKNLAKCGADFILKNIPAGTEKVCRSHCDSSDADVNEFPFEVSMA